MRAVARRHLRADHQSRAYRDARESARGCHASVRLPGPREKAATTTLIPVRRFTEPSTDLRTNPVTDLLTL